MKTESRAELTLRGLVLGVVLTVVFTAANVYFGLKAGLTFSTSIPAVVISMAMLRWLGNALSVNESVSPQLGAWMPQITLVLTTIVLGVPTTLIRRRA